MEDRGAVMPHMWQEKGMKEVIFTLFMLQLLPLVGKRWLGKMI